MRSVTEFFSIKLLQGIKLKGDLAAQGKTPEEIQQAIGETFKLEGDKLKYFCNAMEVAGQNLEGLSRVLVISFNEGENIPPKAAKMEEMHYVPEFQREPGKPMMQKKAASKPGRGKGRGGGGRPKETPWGVIPEEKPAKAAPPAKSTKPE